jgi:hypothetical protein
MADLHENVLAIKADGPTKEDFAWGFRTGFLTFASKGLNQAQIDALQVKFMSAIRSSVSCSSTPSQAIIKHAFMNTDHDTQKAELRKMLHPRSVVSVKVDGKAVEEDVLRSVSIYFAVYSAIIALTFLVISFEPFTFETNFSAVLACVNNIGPGVAGVGPMSSYADYTGFSKIVLSFAMLLGRLEIYPLLIALTPSTWTKK